MSKANVPWGNTVDVEFEDRIAFVYFNRPEKKNCMSPTLNREMYATLHHLELDDRCDVLVLTGRGEAWSAGMDLKEAAQTGLGVPPAGFLPIVGQNVTLTKPIIAAVNGVAYAGGWLFAQMCDLCLAAEHACFGITEARVGRGMPGAAPLVHMVQQRAVMELLLTGDPISAARAHEIGFVNHVVPAAELMPRAMTMARRIADNAPLTVGAARELVYLATEMGRSAAQRAATHLFAPVYLSEDAQEGPRAFREKRAPEWKGR